MLAHVGNGSLAPVGAAQAGVSVQCFALGVQIILLAGIRGIVDQQSLFVVGCGLNAVFQLAGVEGDVAVNEPRGFLRKGELGLLQGSGLFCAEVGAPAQLHLHTIGPVLPAVRGVENRFC